MRRNVVVFGLLAVSFLARSSWANDDEVCRVDAPKGEGCVAAERDVHQYGEKANVVAKDVRVEQSREVTSQYWKGKTTIHLGCVVCNDRAPEALTMLKSAVMFSKSPVHFHIFVEDKLRSEMALTMDKWLDVRSGRVEYFMYEVRYPDGQNSEAWRTFFKPCATMRLFIPLNTAESLDSIIYLDTDTLIYTPLEDVWAHFSRFNSTQLAAMTPEGEDPNAGWYNRFARHPYYGSIGVNSGVMPMNLTRIRSADGGKWHEEMMEIFKTYRYDMTWGDQDILNVYFSRHPERLYVYPCEWNYRPDHCMYMSNCLTAETNGCKVLHGNRGSFHGEKQPAFKAIYNAFQKHPATNEVTRDSLYKLLVDEFSKVPSKGCGEIQHVFLASLDRSLKKL